MSLQTIRETLTVLLWTTTPITCFVLTGSASLLALQVPRLWHHWLHYPMATVSGWTWAWHFVCGLAFTCVVAYAVWMAYDWHTPFRGGTHDRLAAIRTWKEYSQDPLYGGTVRVVLTRITPILKRFGMDLGKAFQGWNAWRAYFPVSFHAPPPHALPSDRNYILAMHPHGLYCFGAFANFVAGGPNAPFCQHFPSLSLRLATLRFNFLCPLWREINLSYGFIAVDFQSCFDWLTHRACAHDKGAGRALLLVIGGAEEALHSSTRSVNLVLAKRKGFVKLALMTGAALIPCFSFGETLIYASSPPSVWMASVQAFLKRWLGWTIPVCRGRFGIWVPYRQPIITVVGSPLHLPHVPDPTPDQINQYHQQYVQALQKLWDDHKHLDPAIQSGHDPLPLNIIA